MYCAHHKIGIMSVMQRRTHTSNHKNSTTASRDDDKKSKRGANAVAILVFCAAIILYALGVFGGDVSRNTMHTSSPEGTSFLIDSGVTVTVDFQRNSEDTSVVTLGPHFVSLQLPSHCSNPALWMRLEGDALVGIVLHERDTKWDGSFTIPMEGKYSLTANWLGCNGRGEEKYVRLTNVTAKGILKQVVSNSSLYPSSAWITAKKFTQTQAITQPYVWHNPELEPPRADLLKTSETFISKQSTTGQSEFYKFSDLSNYELVCWIGSQSAELIWSSFLKLRPLVHAGQRPFKFHLYESDSFVKPAGNWSENKEMKFRKCKHILISMDQVKEPSTQSEYVQQVTTFINHLLTAFPDETFPIWMFTVMEPPKSPHNCLDPVGPRSSEHPCNDALKALFKNSPFPDRVQLLDNTDITFPQLGENLKDVATAIALRIFVFVGKQVSIWRKNRQKGTIKGLERGDNLEPNFELVPYTGWK